MSPSPATPFGTSGRKLTGPVGYKIVRVDLDAKQVKEFIRNVSGTPAHQMDRDFDKGIDALGTPLRREVRPRRRALHP